MPALSPRSGNKARGPRAVMLGALGLVVNAIVLWNILYMESALQHLRHVGDVVDPEREIFNYSSTEDEANRSSYEPFVRATQRTLPTFLVLPSDAIHFGLSSPVAQGDLNLHIDMM